MNYTRNIYLDVNATSAVTVVKAKQGDDSLRYINITLQKDGVKLTPETGCSATFRLEKPDGKAVVNSASIGSDGTITVTLTKQCTAKEGKCKADIFITDSSGNTISTALFVLEVVKSPDVTNQIASSDEYGVLVDLIHEVEDLITDNAICTASVTITSSGWSSATTVNNILVYSHAVSVTGYTVTANTRADLSCDRSTLAALLESNVTSMFIVNNSGTLTAYAISAKPTSDITVQVALTEVKQL